MPTLNKTTLRTFMNTVGATNLVRINLNDFIRSGLSSDDIKDLSEIFFFVDQDRGDFIYLAGDPCQITMLALRGIFVNTKALSDIPDLTFTYFSLVAIIGSP